MKSRRFVLCAALAAATMVGAAERPNIIFILADDLGYGDLGITGHPYVRSPNIDQLAKDGIRLEQYYTAGAWCSPSRAGLMGGVYPARDFNVNNRVLNVNRPSLTSMLKGEGYATAHFGKWHIGSKNGAPPPSDYGVDESLTTQSTGPSWSKEARKDEHHRENSTPHYVDLAVDFMSRHQEQPFFINLWVNPTHSYINPTPEQLAVYKDLKVDINDFENPLQREFLEFVSTYGDVQAAMRAYCADVTALDSDVGRLLQSLKEMSLDENTIVIFSSDNGPGPLCSNWDSIAKRYTEKPLLLNNVGSAGPYRDRKISLHDGGIHAPFFVRWPAKIQAGSVNENTLFCGVDLFPTLGKLVGAEIPAGLDGQDLSAAWLGESIARSEPILWNDKPDWFALRDGKWKAHLQKNKLRLYDLSTDRSESNDVAGKYPEVADRYMNRLKQWERALPKVNK